MTIIEDRESKKIRYPCMFPFNVFTEIKHYTREEVKYQRETHRQKR